MKERTAAIRGQPMLCDHAFWVRTASALERAASSSVRGDQGQLFGTFTLSSFLPSRLQNSKVMPAVLAVISIAP